MWCGGNCSGAYEKEEVKKEREEGGGVLSREIATATVSPRNDYEGRGRLAMTMGGGVEEVILLIDWS